jgi:hypothetical protein
MKTASIIALATIWLGTSAAAAPAASPAPPAAVSRHEAPACFYANQWQGWRALDARAMLIRVNMHEIWRVEFAQECRAMLAPGVHWISKFRDGDLVCSPIDLDLTVADTTGFREPCIVTGLKKLTPDEITRIPRTNLP